MSMQHKRVRAQGSTKLRALACRLRFVCGVPLLFFDDGWLFVQAGFTRASMDVGDAPHKTFCKEVSGKKVVDLFFHKVRQMRALLKQRPG